jgi:sulfopyruvate decarboxylase TPP-binding subunit
MSTAMAREDWSKLIFDKLAGAGVTLFSYVPDFGNASLVEIADEDNRTRTVLLSSEQEGVALCAGADLVGGRGVLLMQSSGVGNVPNMLSLVQSGRFPMLMIVTMRGEYGEQNPWQYPMGQAVVPVLERDDELDQAVESAISASYVAGQGVALILTQKFLGAKAF